MSDSAMTTAQINTAIIRALFEHGTDRPGLASYKQIALDTLAAVTGLDADTLRGACDTLCAPTQFSDATLVRVADGVYAHRVHRQTDNHSVHETDDLRFAVHRGRYEAMSVHDTLTAATDAAEEADGDLYRSRVRVGRPVDATFHDCGRNRNGEVVCYPDP